MQPCPQLQDQKEIISFETVKASSCEQNGFYLEQYFTSCLAQYAYYIESQGEAVIIDPMREIDQYLDIIAKRKSQLKYIMNTHFHADFVSGHYDLANVTKAKIIYGPTADSEEEIIVATDNQEFKIGKIIIKLLHTPGHTLESSCYLIIDEDGKQRAIFTGDTVFMGDVGRPDLAIQTNITKEDLAGMLFESLRTKVMTLPEDVALFPGHGAGSSCGKNIQSGNSTTVGKQLLTNYALNSELIKEEFVRKVTADIPQAPQYFFENAKMNKKGYKSIFELIEKSTTPLKIDQFEAEMANGAIIIDSRKVCEYMNTGIIPGSVCLSYSFPIAVWLGTLMDVNQKYLLVSSNDAQKEKEIATRFARVGFEHLLGYLDGGFDTWMKAGKPIEKIDFIEVQELPKLMKNMIIVDVRKQPEYNRIHLDNVILAPLSVTFMNQEYKKIPKDQDILIHCKSGLRSICAISLLRRMGYKNKIIEIKGGMDIIEKNEAIPLVKAQ